MQQHVLSFPAFFKQSLLFRPFFRRKKPGASAFPQKRRLQKHLYGTIYRFGIPQDQSDQFSCDPDAGSVKMNEKTVKGHAEKKACNHTTQVGAGIFRQELPKPIRNHGEHQKGHDRNAEIPENKDGRNPGQNPRQFSRAPRTDRKLAAVPVKRPVRPRMTSEKNP